MEIAKIFVPVIRGLVWSRQLVGWPAVGRVTVGFDADLVGLVPRLEEEIGRGRLQRGLRRKRELRLVLIVLYLKQVESFFCSTSLPLASTRCVRSTLSIFL